MGTFKAVAILQTDAALVDEFVAFAQKVRAPDYRVGVAAPEQTRRLLAWGFAHGSTFWLVRNSRDEALLRLSLLVTPADPAVATVGFFEADLAHADLSAAVDFLKDFLGFWGRKEGVRKLVGPVDINTWFNYRFSVPGKKFFPRYKWEPTTPPEYIDAFRKLGFSDFAYYRTVFFPHLRLGSFCLGTGAMKRSYRNVLARGFTMRPFDAERFLSHEVPACYEISQEVFKDALLFEPIDLETFRGLYAVALRAYDFTPSSLLVSPEGEIAGFIFAFYDGDFLVIKSIAVTPKYQGQNLSSGLIYNAVKQSFRLGKKGTISALVRSGIASEGIEKNASKTTWLTWKHNYLLLNKDVGNE